MPREEWHNINSLFVGLGQGQQQQAERHKLLRRCVDCSRPAQALRLLHLLETDLSGAPDKRSGETALMYAVRQGNIAAVEVLLEVGVKHDLRNSQGKTALDLAEETAQSVMQGMLGAYAAQPRVPSPRKVPGPKSAAILKKARDEASKEGSSG